MNKEISKALIGVAGGATLLAFKPDVSSIVGAGSSLLSLGLELRQFLATKSPESKRGLARVRKAVRGDFRAWLKSEGVDPADQISSADASLASALPQLFLARDSLISAAFEPEGFVRAGTIMIMTELARADSMFQERPNNLARQYATVVVTSALRAVLSERKYFEVLQPYIDLKVAQIIGEIDRKINRVLASAEASGATRGLSRGEVQSLLRAFFEEQVPEEAACGLLLEKAKELDALRAQLAKIDLTDIAQRQSLSQVGSAISDGRYTEADAVLSRIIEEGQSSALKTLTVTVELLCRRAELAHAQAKYLAAARTYEQAAGVAAAVHTRLAWFLLGRQANSLLEHALNTPGTTHFERAIQIAFTRIDMSGSDDRERTESVGLFAMIVGLYAERAENFRARGPISTALKLVSDTLNKLDPLSDGRLMAQVANSYGALLNRALLIGVEEGQKEMQDQAIDRLTQACELATKHAPAELPNIRQNLATALRRKADEASEPAPMLQQAIENRLLVIAETDTKDVRSLANSYESLGNDYQALIRTEEAPDRQIFLQALAAHRRALQLRRNASYTVHIAQSFLNIGLLYWEAARRATGDLQKRFLRLSKRHFERGLHLISQDGSPKLWSWLSCRWGTASIYLLAFGEDMDDSGIRLLGDRMLTLMKFAHGTGDIPILMSGAQLSHQVSTHIYELRRSPLTDVPRAQVSVFNDLLKLYRFIPGVGHDLELWAATFEFMVGDLTDDIGVATNARQRAAQVANTLSSHDPVDLSAVVKELLDYMDTNLATLQHRVAQLRSFSCYRA